MSHLNTDTRLKLEKESDCDPFSRISGSVQQDATLEDALVSEVRR
jgi:hypothetical protein